MTTLTAIDEGLAHEFEVAASAYHWKKAGIKHHHGIAVPLFSLHSSQSAGIGEFLDLIPLIEWLPSVGMDVIQLLPINDTGTDSSPYNAISSCALNPLHLSLASLEGAGADEDLQNCLQRLQALTKTSHIDYKTVRILRDAFLSRYYTLTFSSAQKEESYRSFLRRNDWLVAYATFKTLKEEHQQRSWEDWPEPMRDPTPQAINRYAEEYSSRINYHCFIQYLCWSQMKRVKEVAEAKGVLIKGDIPILISRDSADYWEQRSLFHENLSAGAPPDFYAEEGQDWGFPVYNWKEKETELFQWWQQRLKVAEAFYHLYRLDHVVGFFRIWTIAPGSSAKEGTFLPQDESEWVPLGRKILLMMLESCSMLPIAEDLGVIPPSVRKSLRALKVCGTKVVRWERLWEEEGQPFIKMKYYIPESLTTVSTHDSRPLKMWWKECPEEAEAFAAFKKWNFDEELKRERLQIILRDSHHSGSLFHINLLQEYLQLTPDLLWPPSVEDRINVPGTVGPHNWSIRLSPSVEKLCKDSALRAEIQHLLD